jgi:hypothetical protein
MGSLLALVLFSLWCVNELSERKKRGLKPSNVGSFLLLSKKNSQADPRYPPLYFAGSCFIAFGLWEGLVRAMLGIENYLVITLAAAAALVASIFVRRRRFERASGLPAFTTLDWLLCFLAFGLLNGFIVLILMGPWLWYRSRSFLKFSL